MTTEEGQLREEIHQLEDIIYILDNRIALDIDTLVDYQKKCEDLKKKLYELRANF